MNSIVKRTAIVAALAVAALSAASVPSVAVADEPSVTITDQAGAPADALGQLERLEGRRLGDLDRVVTVDTGGRRLTTEELEALILGRQVEGVRVLGAMPGSRDVLGTTMADLSDGVLDGSGDGGTSTSVVLFATSAPDGRNWCLTMCIASGRSVWECMWLAFLERLGDLIFDLPGSTTLTGVRQTIERAAGVSLGDAGSVETFVSDVELSEQDTGDFLAGREVDSLRSVARLEGPDRDWVLEDVAGRMGVAYATSKGHWFTFELPYLGKISAFCTTNDGGKTWKCVWKLVG